MIVKSLAQYIEDQNTDAAVYPYWIPQSHDLTTPAVTLYLVNQDYVYDVGSKKNIATARIQVDTWGYSSQAVDTIARKLAFKLVKFNQQMGFVYVASCKIVNEMNLAEQRIPGSDEWIYRTMQEFQIRYNQTKYQYTYTASGGLTLGGSAIIGGS